MKSINIFLVAASFTISMFAQSPNKISYQAIVRDAGNNLVKNQTIGMQISILHGSVAGVVVYTEIQTPTTNENGLLSIEIGNNAGFESIDWANGPFYIKTEIDPTGGTNYTIIGTSQILSVPYAFHARTAEEVEGTITETDPVFTNSEAANITATDITNLSNLSGINTGDQDLSSLATKTALGDSTAQVRSEIPDVSGFLGSETDPVYSASQAANITATDITNLGNLSGTNTGDQDLSMLATKTALGDSTAQVRSEIPDVSGFLTSETDPVYSASQAANITATDITNLGNLSGVNTGDQVGYDSNVTGGTNITVTGIGTEASPYVISTTDTLAIGDIYQGGIIFWLDATGQHGLIAATTDQSSGITWGECGCTGTTGDGLYAGAMNTALIVAKMMTINQKGNFAAKVCADYSVTAGGVTYGDWYLPSKYELNLLYLQIAVVGCTYGSAYWSSTENDCYNAWGHVFHELEGPANDTKAATRRVRAIRAF